VGVFILIVLYRYHRRHNWHTVQSVRRCRWWCIITSAICSIGSLAYQSLCFDSDCGQVFANWCRLIGPSHRL